ncbi:MAG: hypothetical protein WCX82_01060 [archaeon]
MDYSGNKLNYVQVSIRDLNDKAKFNEIISNGEKRRIAISPGKDYTVTATKEGFQVYEKPFMYSGDGPLVIQFNELIETGNLKLIVTDSQTNKSVSKYSATLDYKINGQAQEKIGEPNTLGEIDFTGVPIGKDITLTIVSDGYETLTQTIKLTSSNETRTINLEYDNTAQLAGTQSRLILITTTQNGDLLDDCNVIIYNAVGEIIGSEITKLGKTTFTLNAGQAIRFVVTKEGYRIYDSDTYNVTYRLLKSEETITIKMIAGSSDLKVKVTENLVGPLDQVGISLYSLTGNLLSSKTTEMDGQVIFNGLDQNQEYVVTACKDGYLCLQQYVNISLSNDLEISLEKITTDNSYKLSIYVYDGVNNPISKANVLVYKELGGKFVPIGLGPLQVDLTGFTSVYTKSGEKYNVVGVVGDANASKEITIDPFKDNKVILTINDASKIVTLELKDLHGNGVTNGCVVVKSKLGEILSDTCLDETPLSFNTQGYRDLLIEYTDENGATTIVSAVVGDSEKLSVALKPSVIDYNPVITFIELRDIYNNPTSVLSKDADYYLVFDLQLPIDAKSCGVHFRAGEYFESDSENMTYGITGFKADTITYKYSTTYNSGEQSIDTDNVGQPNQLNKWLELYWPSSTLTNKQVMLKVKASEIGTMPIKYRAWCDVTGSTYRDPEDTILGTSKNNSSRQSLYAETKDLSLNILESPAECSNNLCVDYKFLDKDNFDYSKESFFAVKDDLYLLELSYYSVLNGELTIEAQTDNSKPIVGLISYQETELFPTSSLDSQDTKLSSSVFVIQSGVNRKQYILFKAKDTGITYLDIKSTFNSKVIEKRLSFEIKQKRNLIITVPEIIAYNSPIIIDVQDADNKTAINNALVKLTDEFGDTISSTKTGKNGKYIINQNFSSAKPNMEVSAPGYISFTKQLTIADTGLIYAPDSIDISFGESISQESEKITLVNKGSIQVKDLTYTITEIDKVIGLTTETQLPIALNPGAPEVIEIFSTVDPKINFKTGKSILTIYGFVGNKQVAKEITINYYRGIVKNDCLEIKPLAIYAYVGISEGSENEITATIVNNCSKSLIITPELLKAKGTTIKKDENIEIDLPTITIEPNEEITDYTITIRNNKERKSTKSYAFEIAWRNSYYALENTKLNLDLVDFSKTISVSPPLSLVSLTQEMDVTPAANQTMFLLKNNGKYPVKNIQISRFEEKLPSNIQDKIEPISFEEIKPGQSKKIIIRYEGKVDKATYATLYYKVTADAKGVKEPIEARFTVDFRFSSAGCLKVDQKKIYIYAKVGEEKSKLINVTNQCADPVGYITFDPSANISPNLYDQAFGKNTQLWLIPQSPTGFIASGQTVPYILKVKPLEYFPAKIDQSLRLIGAPLNNTPGSVVTSDRLSFSLEVEEINPDITADFKRVEEDVSVKICGEAADSDSETANFTFPIIVTDCKQEGYCDSSNAAEFIAEKIQEMHTMVINASRQVADEVDQTNCSMTSAINGSCPISELLTSEQLAKFRNIPLYVQNDSLSDNTVLSVLQNNKEATKFPTIKGAMVRPNVGATTGGLSIAGGVVIHIDNKINGCGRYKITIDGSVATKGQTKLDAENAYFFVTIDANKTEQCKKSIENIRMYLPKDIDNALSKTNTRDTWLTVISGDKDFGLPVSKGVFNTEDRFQLKTNEQKKFSQLNISVGEIAEDKTAIAKLYFKNPGEPKDPQAETINVIINNKFGIPTENEDVNYPSEFINQTAKDIKNIIEGNPADICISKDRNYMLILSFDKDFGALSLKAKTDKLQLLPTSTCTVVTATSAITEQIEIKTQELPGVKTKFNYQGKESENTFSMILEKDKGTDFNICIQGDISEIANWSNKQLVITAESKYSTVGKINSIRKSDTNITLLNYGITPQDLLKQTQKEMEVLGKDKAKTESNFYAYVDWDKAYNKEDKEAYCSTLEKYNKNVGDKLTIFKKPEACDFEKTKSEIKANNDRAAKRAGTFLAGCLTPCALATAGVDTLWNLLPILGQAKIISDIAWNCAPGCGLPAGAMYLEETEIKIPIWEIIKGFTKEITGDVGELIGKVFSPKNVAMVAGPVGASIVENKPAADRIAISDKIMGADLDPITQTTPNPNPTYPTTTKINATGISSTTTTTTKGLTPSTQVLFEGQLNNQYRYLQNYVSQPTGAPYVAPTDIRFAPGVNVATGMSDDAAVRSLFSKITTSGKLDMIKFNALSNAELTEFERIITTGSYDTPGNWITPDKKLFTDRLNQFTKSGGTSTTNIMPKRNFDDLVKATDDSKAALDTHLKTIDAKIKADYPTPPAAGTDQVYDDLITAQTKTTSAITDIDTLKTNMKSGATLKSPTEYQLDDVLTKQITTDAPKINSAIDDVDKLLGTNLAPPSTITTTIPKTLSAETVDDYLREAKGTQKLAEDQLEKSLAAKAKLEKSGWSSSKINKTKKLKILDNEIDAFTKSKEGAENTINSLENIKAGPKNTAGLYDVTDDLVKNIDEVKLSAKGLASAGVTKWTKFGRTTGKIGLDIGVVVLSNYLGNRLLEYSAETGQYNGLAYGADSSMPITEFRNGTWYKVEIDKKTNNFNFKIVNEIPSIAEDNKIVYENNKEIKEILTSEHREELLQGTPPQKTPEDTTEKTDSENPGSTVTDPETPGSAVEVSADLLQIQVNMYNEKEPKLQSYESCKFPKAPAKSACEDVSAISADYCSTFAQQVAEKNYPGIGQYVNGDAWELGKNNKVVWDAKTDSIVDFEKNLVPGAIITIGITKGIDCVKPSHAILYVGKKDGIDYVIHQFGPNIEFEPLNSRFTHDVKINRICEVVIPSSGYALYDDYAIPKVA